MTDVKRQAVSEVGELGPLGVRHNDAWSPVRGRRSAAVIALLSSDRNRVRTIDELVEAGWAGPDRPATARQSLANVLSRFRRTYGPSFIESGGQGYRLGVEVGSDRARFLDASENSVDRINRSPGDRLLAIEEALGLWRGTPWIGLEDIDEIRIDQSRLVQVHYRLRAVRALELAELGRTHDAISAFTELVAEDATNEAAWNGWAQTLGSARRRVEALRVIDRARSTLAESGLLIGSELMDTERQLLDDTLRDPSPQHHQPARNTDAPLGLGDRPAVFVGREPELDALATDWRRSPSSGRVHFVVGQAGVGKTTLVAEFAHRMLDVGANVLHGACDDVLNLPFQPYLIGLNDWFERSAGGFDVNDPDQLALASILGAGSQDDVDARRTSFRVVDAFRRVIGQVADLGPTIMIVEDLHWATAETVLLTRSLARLVPRGTLIVATMRPGPPGEDDPLAGLHGDAKRVQSITQTTVRDLETPDVAELLAAHAPGREFDPSVLTDLVGGNPLLVSEFARSSAASPSLHAGWALSESQLLALLPHQVRVLELAATLGEVFWAEDVAQASGHTLDDTLEMLATAANQRLVSLTEMGSWQFRHALVRDVVLSRLSPQARADHHLRVAEALAGLRRPRTAQIAKHYAAAVGSGARREAVTWLRRAAHEATRSGAHDQAAQHWAQSIGLDREADAASLIHAHMAHGNALVHAGYWERSHAPFEAAARTAKTISDVQAQADAALGWVQAPENHGAATRFPDFVLETRELRHELDDSRSARLTAILAIDSIDRNHFDDAYGLLDEARVLAERSGDTDTRAFVQRARFRTWWDPAQIDARYQAALDLATLGRLSDSPATVAYGLRWQVVYGIEDGRLESSRALCRQLIAHGHRESEPFHVWFGWSRLAVVNLALGNVADSLECVDRSARLAEILGTSYVHSAQSGVTLGLELQLGPLDLATDRSGVPGLGFIEAIVTGDIAEVRSELAGVDPSQLEDFRHLFGEMPGQLFWHPVGIAAAAVGSIEHAAALVPLLEESRGAFAVHTPGASFLGSSALHLGALRACLGDLDGAVTDLEAAITRNDAVGAKVPSAMCLWLLAGVLDQRNSPADVAAATEARESARLLAPEFDPAASPFVSALLQQGV